MRRAILIFLALLFCVHVSALADWALYKHAGRDYVSFDNVAEFYGLGAVQRVSNKGFTMKIGARSLKGRAGSVEFFINNLKFNLSYPVAEVNGKMCVSRMDLVKVIEPVLRPSKIKGAEQIDTIVLDPGHGGHDNGAYSPYGWEKQFSLDVANRARLLFQQAGYKVVMTRSTDTFVALEERVRFANRFKNALFLSIHFNSGGAGTGLETFTLAPRGVPSMAADGPRITDLQLCPGHANDAENMALATATHAALVVRSKMYDRGIKRARFVVIRDIKIPGVLVEGGFLSNSYDAKLIATPDYRQQMAGALFKAVTNYRRAVGTSTAQYVSRTPESPIRMDAPEVSEAPPAEVVAAAEAAAEAEAAARAAAAEAAARATSNPETTATTPVAGGTVKASEIGSSKAAKSEGAVDGSQAPETAEAATAPVKLSESTGSIPAAN
jgi:N-acetylmuramoyl-L-alanine amidase